MAPHRGGLDPKSAPWTRGPHFLASCFTCAASSDSILRIYHRLLILCARPSPSQTASWPISDRLRVLSNNSDGGSRTFTRLQWGPAVDLVRSLSQYDQHTRRCEVRVSPLAKRSARRSGQRDNLNPLGEATDRRCARRTAMQRSNFERFDERADRLEWQTGLKFTHIARSGVDGFSSVLRTRTSVFFFTELKILNKEPSAEHRNRPAEKTKQKNTSQSAYINLLCRIFLQD